MISKAEELALTLTFSRYSLRQLYFAVWCEVQVLEIKVLPKAELLGTTVILYSSSGLKFDALMEPPYALADKSPRGHI